MPFSGIIAAKLAFMWLTCTSPALSIFGGAGAADEFDADYFGAQYLYKSGYDVDGYIRFVQRVWPAPPSANKTVVLALSQFPPVSQQSAAFRQEIADILPLQAKRRYQRLRLETSRSDCACGRNCILRLRPQRKRFCAGRISTTENPRSPPRAVGCVE